MDREAWWATVHGDAESDTTERITLSLFHVCKCKDKNERRTLN